MVQEREEITIRSIYVVHDEDASDIDGCPSPNIAVVDD
jgi:hypothetical protein